MPKATPPPPPRRKKIDYAKVEEAFDFAQKRFKKASPGAEGFLMTFHMVKDGRLIHNFEYHNFPNGDFPTVVMATALEGKRAQLTSQTGVSKV